MMLCWAAKLCWWETGNEANQPNLHCRDLVVRHERMIHFERKPTTRMTSRKARKYEPRRESQSSESVTVSSEAPSERKLSLPTPTIDAAAAKKTAEEALSAAILQGIPNIFDDITPPTPKTATKRRASAVELSDNDTRPTKLQILDQTLTSPASVAPVAPMFGRTAGTAPNSAASSTAISPTTVLPTTGTRVIPDTSSIFPGFAIDPLLQDPEFEAQLDDEETVEDTLKMFTHAEQQLFSPPLSDGTASENGDKEETTTTTRGNEEYLRDTATEAWKLQLEEEVKVAG
ncbi:hypothetical protein TWF694_004458 [Orbilia ellipsospora]|uniref:Uncharacterized protein n=1 Tax=Orbilia ellipsospora TaxID=2528407 RepID=A0AAV9WXE3_9PEZI